MSRVVEDESYSLIETRGLAELMSTAEMNELILPFPAKSSFWRRVSGHGRCIQGVDGSSTHRGTLAYSFDFQLAVGTPVKAVRGGWIAAVVSHFGKGGAKQYLAPRANFVAVKHDDGSYARYYHLKKKGVPHSLGTRVEAGQVVGYSGNTGYTGGPHLHVDVVNILPEETSLLKHGTEILPSIAAAFSMRLPKKPLKGSLCYFSDAVEDWAAIARRHRKDDESVEIIGLADRDPTNTFASRIASLVACGCSAVIIANHNSGPELFAMGGCESPTEAPAVLVSKETAAQLKKLLSKKKPVNLELSAHPAVVNARTIEEMARDVDEGAQMPLSCEYGPQLRYVTRTLPVKFLYGTKQQGVVPKRGKIYPPPTVCGCGGGPPRDRTTTKKKSKKAPKK